MAQLEALWSFRSSAAAVSLGSFAGTTETTAANGWGLRQGTSWEETHPNQGKDHAFCHVDGWFVTVMAMKVPV